MSYVLLYTLASVISVLLVVGALTVVGATVAPRDILVAFGLSFAGSVLFGLVGRRAS